MVRLGTRDSQPLAKDKDFIILGGGPTNRWPPLPLPQLELSSPCSEGARGEHHLGKDPEDL